MILEDFGYAGFRRQTPDVINQAWIYLLPQLLLAWE